MTTPNPMFVGAGLPAMGGSVRLSLISGRLDNGACFLVLLATP